jgi:hypothetical protein
MYIVRPHKVYDEEKLKRIIKEMKELGTPTIKAVFDGEKFIAIEGSHRIEAAYKLGLIPNLEILDYDDEIKHDFEDLTSPCKVSEVLEYLDNISDADNYFWFEIDYPYSFY